MQLYILKLTIFSGGLWGIDLFFIAVMTITYITAKKQAAEKRVKIWQVSPIVLTAIAFVLWIVSIIWRALDI